MAVVLGNKLVAILFIGIIIAGSVTSYMVIQALDAAHHDPSIDTRHYEITGTLCEKDCNGNGTSTYANETNNARLFNVSFWFRNADRSQTLDFGMEFQKDGTPSTLYTKIGEDTSTGKTLTIWYYSYKDVNYTFYVGENSTAERIIAVSSDFSITANLTGEDKQ